MKLGKFLLVLGILFTFSAIVTSPSINSPDAWSTAGYLIGYFAPGIFMIWYGKRRINKAKKKQQETEIAKRL